MQTLFRLGGREIKLKWIENVTGRLRNVMNGDNNHGIRPMLISIALVVLVILLSVLVLAELSALRHLWQRRDILLLHTLEQTVLALESETNTATELTNSIRWLWSYTYEINHYNGYGWGAVQPYMLPLS